MVTDQVNNGLSIDVLIDILIDYNNDIHDMSVVFLPCYFALHFFLRTGDANAKMFIVGSGSHTVVSFGIDKQPTDTPIQESRDLNLH